LKAIIPVVPTTDRTFTTAGQVLAFLRVYEGGKSAIAPVTLRISILDSHDKAVFERTDTLTPDRFTTDRAADVKFDLPLTQLSEGPHVLTFQATSGKATASRDVMFVVR
jgi:hypothetical protein